MYYCNEFLSLSVLSLYEGELIGKVDKLYFDKKLKRLISLELIGENDTRYILPSKNIYRVGKNAITVKNNQAVSLKVEETDLLSAPINSKVYSINGEYLGIVKEISMNEKFLCEKLSLENTTLPISLLATCGKNTVIFYDNTEKINLNKFKTKISPKIFKNEEVQTAEIQPSPNVVPVETPKNVQNTDFLLGRICTKDIFNFNNELLIKSHATITKKNLKEIKKYGKIRELMLYLK